MEIVKRKGGRPKADQIGRVARSIGREAARKQANGQSHQSGRGERAGAETIGCWYTYAVRMGGLAKQACCSKGFLLAAMVGHFGTLTDEQRRDAATATFAPCERDRSTSIWAWADVIQEIRYESIGLGVSHLRLVAAMVIAWERATDVEKTAALRTELGREQMRRERVRAAVQTEGGAA